MELFFGKFIFLYLLMPVIGILLGIVMIVVAKKNRLLSDKKVVIYFLLAFVVLVVPALLGLIDYKFMPYAYVGLMILYLVLGYQNLIILSKVIQNFDEKPYYVEFLCTFSLMFVSAAFFSFVFNLCNELQYGLWACTCLLPFVFPSLFLKTYQTYMDIPLEIRSIWSYNKEHRNAEEADYDPGRIIVVELEIVKQIGDAVPLNIKSKTSEVTPFGLWFKTFVEDYNKKSSHSPIVFTDTTDSYGWIFYVITSVLGRERYIDPNLSFAENKLKEKNVIIAKRVENNNKIKVEQEESDSE